MVAVLIGCSQPPQLARNFDDTPEVVERPEPRLLASGVLGEGGIDSAAEPIEWRLEEITGFTYAISLTMNSSTTTTVRSASRQDLADTLWMVGVTLPTDGTRVVFGGIDPSMDEVVVRNADGDELDVDVRSVDDLGWAVAIEQIPAEWVGGPEGPPLHVVGSIDGVEVASEELAGF